MISINDPNPTPVLKLCNKKIDTGTACGALGFPLASVSVINNQPAFNLVERFQGSFISAFQTFGMPGNKFLDFYETDSVVYGGSSGCPGFTVEGNIFGMVIGTASDGTKQTNYTRLAISRWVPSMDIIAFANMHGFSNLVTI